MPKAILALRRYPLAILMALVLFVCSFLIATSSIGTIRGGDDDQGSGMGGTGRSGGLNGDSGFGGTGGPSPFLSDNATVDDNSDAANTNDTADSLIAPFLQQQQEIETARIPDDMRPLIELQRTAPPSPDFRDSAPALDVLDDDNARELPPHARRVLDMADASNTTIVEPALEIRIQIPDAPGTDTIERFRLEIAEPSAAALPGSDAEPDADADRNSGAIEDSNADAPFALERLGTEEIAGNDADSTIDESSLTEDTRDSDRPLIPERIQRPELPPFQRMRPAVDRAAITPPRPRPMQI